jgi:hypothetical protein
MSQMDPTFATEGYSSTEISFDSDGVEINRVMAQPQLPSDPNDDFYLINCFVCQEVAKPGQVNTPFYI